ncbi:MAG TPA: hypothetical protein VHK70_00875, partial [Burkholderiaceae bacterium]|nr:hypothetical protein [Burkholderiaceae bacterium]
AVVSALLCAGAAWGQMRLLSEGELSAARGQGLMLLTNSSYGGMDFTRIGLGADITLSANFQNLRLGEYNYAPRNATGADLDMPVLRFGRSDATDTQRLVQIKDPYFEFAYRNVADAGTREVVGMRFGFDGIAGDIGLTLNTLSGSMLVDGGAAGLLDSRTDLGGGKRWDGACTAPCLPLNQLGGVTAGDATGMSRDFWVSVAKIPIQFQPPPGTTQVPDIAQAGFWLNWRDRLKALSVDGVPPPNLPLTR